MNSRNAENRFRVGKKYFIKMELKTLIKFFQEEYLFIEIDSIMSPGNLYFNEDNEVINKFLNLMPIIVDRDEYFTNLLPFKPAIIEFDFIESNKDILVRWNDFVFLLRRTIEKRDLGKPVFRFTEPKSGLLPMRAFYPKNPLDIDDSLGFVRPY